MKFAVDMDDTITAWPDEFRELMASLMDAGHEVYVLTGAMDPVEASEKVREGELFDLGLERGIHFNDIHVCLSDSYEGIAKLKGKFCYSKNINVDFDDKSEYQDEIRKQSPGTLCLKVEP